MYYDPFFTGEESFFKDRSFSLSDNDIRSPMKAAATFSIIIGALTNGSLGALMEDLREESRIAQSIFALKK